MTTEEWKLKLRTAHDKLTCAWRCVELGMPAQGAMSQVIHVSCILDVLVDQDGCLEGEDTPWSTREAPE
jgi:hypothetical protein